MKNAPGFKIYSILFITLLFACSMFLASCFGDSSDATTSNTQTSAITPIGVPAVCLTVHPPLLVKLPDGQYKLVEEINNCGKKGSGPLDVTAQITAGTTIHNESLIGPPDILAKGKAMYQTYPGQPGSTGKEIDFLSPSSSPADIIVLATLNGVVQGEWDGQVTIPGF